MADNISILVKAKLSDDKKDIEEQIHLLSGKIKERLELKLKIDASDLKVLTKEVEDTKKKLKIKTEVKGSQFINTKVEHQAFNEISTRIREIRKNIDQLAKVDINTNTKGKITSATLTYYNKELGQTIKETMGWSEAQKKVNGELTKIKTFGTKGFKYTDDLKKVDEQLKSVTNKLNNKYQDALKLGVKFENLSPENTKLLEHQLNRYKNIIKSFQEKNKLGISVSDKELAKLQNLENRIKRLYETTRITHKDTQGFDFSQYPKMENAIKNVTNANEYYNKSIIKGKKLLEANVAETDKYIKVSQRLRDGSEITNLTTYINKATGETHKFSESMKDLMTRTYDYGSAIKTAATKMMLWIGTGGVIFTAISGLKEMTSVIIEVDSKLIELQKVMSSDTNFTQMFENATAAAREYGRTITEVLDAQIEFAKMGYGEIEATELAKTALLGANVFDMDTAEVADRLTGALAQFNIEAEKSRTVIDAVNQVDNEFAVTSQGLLQGIQKSGETAQQFGVDFNTLLGYITAVTTATRESGNVIGKILPPNMVTY